MDSSSDWHQRRVADARTLESAERRVSERLSNVRLTVAGLTALVAIAAFRGDIPPWAGWLAGGGLAVFLALVIAHDRVERRIRWHASVADWHEDRIHRQARAWDRLPEPWLPDLPAHHPFARDLDLFGRVSVFELIGPPGTRAGHEVLADWLLHPAGPDEVARRQEALRELAQDGAFRERVAAHGRIVARVAAFDLGTFLEWAEADHWLLSRPWLVWLVRLLSVANVLLIAAQAAGMVQNAWWMATVTVGLVVSWVSRHQMAYTLGRATGWEPAIRAYVDWLRLVEARQSLSPALEHIRQELLSGGEPASGSIARFQRLVALAELRHNALLHFPVHALTLWDFHVWIRLERWQQQRGRFVRHWIDALARLEALVSMATLASDHPDWVEPHVAPEYRTLEATQLGHPLLRPAVCVRNDVKVGPSGRLLCITGSNMSGKSTLLRALGVNVVLAQAGAPVCAANLTMPPLVTFASLRVVDSLAEGVSFFMAALAQLKQLIVAADDTARTLSPGRPLVFYLLDEILQGTNSIEREAAVRIVVRHLLVTPALGVITTHDLALTECPELRDAGDHWHFRETIHESTEGFGMTFDYTLRPGVATSRNALALLRLVGLSDAPPQLPPS